MNNMTVIEAKTKRLKFHLLKNGRILHSWWLKTEMTCYILQATLYNYYSFKIFTSKP